MRTISIRAALAAMLFAGIMVAIGCTDSPTSGGQQRAESTTTQAAKNVRKHDHWWCNEHGIPEDECSMCSAKVAEACKEKGDWCDKHDRAKSQCFICDPSLKEKYAKRYRDKYGKEPPPIEEENPEPADSKKK
jgi:hypothetical protein